MKHTFYQIIGAFILLILSTSNALAQNKDTTTVNIDNIKIIITDNGDTIKRKKNKEGTILSISNQGIKIGNALKKKKKKHKKLHTGMHFDFGINNVIDNTNYTNAQTNGNFLTRDTSSIMMTEDDLSLRNGKSINFNFWPVWLSQDIARHNVQIETGIGFQFFNYRFTTDVVHQDGESGGIVAATQFREVTDPALFKGKEKNKFGVSYVSVPLMLRFNSNKKKGHRYFVGAGVIGSYKLKSWTKFYGNKNSGDFGVNDWMTQVTAELGVTGIIKLYGTYALQSMYSNGLDRQPFALGIRL